MLNLFGGLGSRSRRGGGNFAITKISDTSYNKYLLNNKDQLKGIYTKIRDYFEDTYRTSDVNNEYSTLSTDLNSKLSPKSFESWNTALKEIETKYKNFRKKHKLLQNASFGLPIVFKDNKNKVEVFTNPEFERRASPMIIKVQKIQDKYYWLVLKINGEFLPKGTKIGSKKEQIDKDIDENIVDDFMESLR